MQLTISPDALNSPAPALGPEPAARHPWLVALCLLGYLLFCLQQVVIGHGMGVGLSLGSMAIRAFAIGFTLWMLWHHGVPRPLWLPGLAILVCLLALAICVLASDYPDIAVKAAVRYATELIALWVLLNLSLAFPCFAPAAALAMLIALWLGLVLALAVRMGSPLAHTISLAFHLEETFKYFPRVSGFYEHPALLGATGVIVLMLAAQLHHARKWGLRLFLAAALGAFLALLLSGARNPLLPLFVLGGAWLWPRRHHRRVWLYVTLIGGSVFLLTAIAVFSRYTEVTSAHQESFLTAFSLGRTYLWMGAFDAWRSQPWFGLGPGVYQFLVPDFTGGRFHRGELHAHNVLLGVMSEMGLVGLVAWLLLAYALWRPWLRRGEAPGRAWAMTWLLSLLSLGLFDFYIPFYGFALHAALAISMLYTLSPGVFQRSALVRSTRQTDRLLVKGITQVVQTSITNK